MRVTAVMVEQDLHLLVQPVLVAVVVVAEAVGGQTVAGLVGVLGLQDRAVTVLLAVLEQALMRILAAAQLLAGHKQY
jgi:hypothetical protein